MTLHRKEIRDGRDEHEQGAEKRMAVDQRENSNVVRLSAYRSGICERRDSGENVSRGISTCWCGIVWGFHRLLGRQESEVKNMPTAEHHSDLREPIQITLTTPSKIRKWAFENAYTLIAMAIFFIITWILIVIEGVRHVSI